MPTYNEDVAEVADIADNEQALAVFSQQLLEEFDMITTPEAVLPTVRVLDGLGLGDKAEYFFEVLAAEGIDFSDPTEILYRVIQLVVDEYGITQSQELTVYLLSNVEETVGVPDDLSPTMLLQMLLADEFDMNLVAYQPEESYLGVIVNTDNTATSEYENYGFNSFARIGSKYYGCKADGIYLLEGADDNGDFIEATMRTGLLDMGTMSQKRMTRAYLGVDASGKMLFKTITDSGIERWYEMNVATTGWADRRVKLGRKVQALYWQFELQNVDGSQFDLDKLELFPIVMGRRFGGIK